MFAALVAHGHASPSIPPALAEAFAGAPPTDEGVGHVLPRSRVADLRPLLTSVDLLVHDIATPGAGLAAALAGCRASATLESGC
ncbi:hypothetical protein [Saccharothrix australiensis]|uniref:Uncharacterized protein n=1 Tax=Saccharothrix australiensis TaxID=2072 RepID=A0A495W3B4_9PSEU|nr:hypothetical protein [Saccharothrix australiensis]RKT54308.1 hypothetical protein C8E97_2924 [Saccharothrix australiensis]